MRRGQDSRECFMGSRSFVNRAKARFPLHALKLFSLGTDAHLALVHRSGKSAHVAALHGARQAVVAGRQPTGHRGSQ